MTTASALVTFLLSSGGMACVLTALSFIPLARATRRWRIVVAVAAAGYALAAYQPIPARVESWLVSQYRPLARTDVPQSRPAVVVLLGSGSFTALSWSNDRLLFTDPVGADRVIEAYRAFVLLNPQWLVSSGGSPDPNDPDLPSADAMHEALTSLGVPRARILVERQSRTTREQAVAVKSLLREHGVADAPIVLVTSAVHMRRSIGAFRAEGMQPIPAIARHAPHSSGTLERMLPTSNGLALSSEVVHELLGLAYYSLRGWHE